MDTTATGFGGMGLTLLGGLTSVFGNIAEGESQKKMYDYQAGVARLNAQIAERNAQYASDIGELQAGAYGLKAASQLGSIKATQGAHGLDVRTGSAKQVQDSQRLVSAIDMAAIRSNAAKNAFDYRQQAQGAVAQAGADTMAGKNAALAGDVKAASSFLSTASSVDSMWLQGQKSGLWGSP